jgi:hypothetical protein
MKRVFLIGLVFSIIGCSRPQTDILIKGQVNVGAELSGAAFQTYSFVVNPSTMKNVFVKGQFVASGGSGNDIVALIFDDIGFTNWKNGHASNALYDSGQVTTDRFNVPITQPGTYYFVLSNRFSTITPKTVDVAVTLDYDKAQKIDELWGIGAIVGGMAVIIFIAMRLSRKSR